LEYLRKLIEKAAVRQLTDHRTENGMYALHQSAYRKHHSTETAMIKIVNDVLSTIDGRKCVALVMLDLSAAFDTVSHNILLQHLEEDSGVQGAALLWMQSYHTIPCLWRSWAINMLANVLFSGAVSLTLFIK
jgi:hypothetical protein